MATRGGVLRIIVRIGMLALLAASASATSMSAQSDAFAETARGELAYFVGIWNTQGEMRSTLQGPFGAFTSLDQARWMTGERYVVVEAQSTSANGPQFQLSVLGYDATRRGYTFRSFNSRGIETTATGRLDGSRWTWETAAPSAVRIRHVITIVSSTEYIFQFDMSVADGAWVTFARGTALKVR